MQEGGHGNLPSVADFIQLIGIGYLKIGKKHLAEAGFAGHFNKGANLHTFTQGLPDGDHEIGQPFVFGGSVMAAKDDHPGRELSQ